MNPSPNWSRAMPPGPDARVKITEEYAKHVARDAYFWAWPLVNMYNRRLFFATIKEMAYVGPLPQAPLNTFGMLTDYIAPEQRSVACPNQDVVYGAGYAALDISPVVVQVPEFGTRFWVYQIVDLRTDAFAQIGKMYGTTPGFYLLAGPNWQGEAPRGITKVFRCSTNTAFVGPRVFQDDTPEDRKAIQTVLQQIVMYPLSEYDGTSKRIEWQKLPKKPGALGGARETQWVFPEKFFDELAAVLTDAPPLPGEEARYAQVLAVLEAAKSNPALKQRMIEAAKEAEEKLLTLYSQYHFFVANEINRYSVGTKNKDLTPNADGSLTIVVQADPPPDAQRANWLPAPKGEDFSLFMRAYWPQTAVIDGSWTPPAVETGA